MISQFYSAKLLKVLKNDFFFVFSLHQNINVFKFDIENKLNFLNDSLLNYAILFIIYSYLHYLVFNF